MIKGQGMGGLIYIIGTKLDSSLKTAFAGGA
jgi:hypothetical protein